MEIFSQRLKYERKQQKMSQRRIAKLLGISQGTYAHYELLGTKNGREPPLEVIDKIATILGVTTDYLFGRED